MGYLTDNLSVRGVASCSDIYPYEMVVVWELNDPFTAPNAVDQMSQAIKAVIPDVEEWQVSVLKGKEKRVKYRFRTEPERNQASNALTSVDFAVGPIFIKRIAFQNAPDRVTRGVE
jgi:hypothetical protein